MDAEQIKTLLDMRMAKYPDHACLMQELTFKDEKIAALEAENAKLKEALRECVEGFDSTTGFTDEEGDPLSRAMLKAREVLGDA